MRPLVLLVLGLLVLQATLAQNDPDYTDEGFEVPDPIIEVFRPRGLRVSLPHKRGVKLFVFHGNINKDIGGSEPGTIVREVKRHRDNYWTTFDASIRVKPGDVINYWIYVDWNDGSNTLGYTKEDGFFYVTDKNLVPISQINQPITPPTPTEMTTRRPTTTTTTTRKPTTKPVRRTTTEAPLKCQVRGVTRVQGKATCAGQLLFEEEFNKPLLNKKKWKYEIKLGSAPDFEFVSYVNHPDNVIIKNGNLYIKPTLASARLGEDFIHTDINLGRNCTGTAGTLECSKNAVAAQILPPILSGRISTKDSFWFLYGKVEIRAKLPRGNWIYPILFLQPKENFYGKNNYDSGQMRIAWAPGNANLGKQLTAGAVLSPTADGRTAWMKFNQADAHWGNGFHIYTLKWTPGRISLSVDGTEYGIVEPPELDGFSSVAQDVQSSAGDRWSAGTPMAPFDKDMYLTIGVGVGGHSFTEDPKPWKNLDPKNMFNFWKAKDQWFNTWNDNSALRIDYVKITAY